MKLIGTFSFLIGLAFAGFAQTCDCPATFEWMVETFETNDAGFQHVLDKKGEEEYRLHTDLIRGRVAEIDSITTCTHVLNEWLHFFRNGHIGIGPKDQSVWHVPAGNASSTRTVKLTEDQLIKRLGSRGFERHSVEGVWSMGAYRVGVIRDDDQAESFSVVIIESRNPNWNKGQVKAELKRDSDGKLSGTFYMGDHSPKPVDARVIGKGGVLDMNGYWQRHFPEHQPDAAEELFMRFATADEPFFSRLNDRTSYIRIPSFAIEKKPKIDSVLAANDDLIRNTENLIIDIRNGTGGSDASYSKLIPYLYTGPIRSVGVQLLATELNAQACVAYAKTHGADPEMQARMLKVAELMRENIGQFVDPLPERIFVDSSHTVLPLPHRVGIIHNENNGSTDEQFLLAARTSSKVKLFGHSTRGVLDISNMNFVDSPDGLFFLGFSMSKSYRIPHLAIDDVGVQPDHFLDEGIPEEEWIEYVREVLER
jgi:hypothetical protein